ncbi:hypothetical protein GCM10028796_34040 [Ramlibacter monticola]|uniref:N-formylglutamate amidohydrolase n=1 Tax=Ramlibacter monticola TaxID=1926872 RepID=A0A937CVW1_9BURK|nr:N-formylglutamate amidohydrolase [Ramlibacter monticola]MBL0395265.1 N-formylglutamate amidohydrolase [Ramlibacter monticola]
MSFRLRQGSAPLLVSLPHLGTEIPPALRGNYTLVLDGRFKGGYIARHYGRPAEHVHAVQLEMGQRTYMREEPPYDWDALRAAEVQPVVRAMVEAALAACRRLHG